MGCYLMCNDSLGQCMSIFVYVVMALGQFVFFFAIVKPELGTDGEEDILIEYAVYSAMWLLMLLSHVMTMCVDPGFIPHSYRYDEQVLAAPFSTLAAASSAISSQSRLKETGHNDEEQARSISLDNSRRSGKKSIVNDSGTKAVELGNMMPKLRAEENQKKQAISESVKESGLTTKVIQQLQTKIGKKCNKCDCVKPPRTHHCSTCGRCVLKMDHHCPWMNNCIGLHNQKAFLLFNFYTMITAAWTLVRVAGALMSCAAEEECDTFEGGLSVIAVILVFLCGLFALFCAVMFCDQCRMITEDTSTIDRMQAAKNRTKQSKGKEASKSRSGGLCNTCGGCSVCFCLPCNFGLDLTVENQLHND